VSYDVKCEELARAFLTDELPFEELEVAELAQTIQQAIEDWLEARRAKKGE
jgi:hypothetical protein